MGDTLTLFIEYRNKTKKDIEFYPDCFQALTQPIVAFGIDETLVLNLVLNFTKLISLAPNCTYSQKYVVKSDQIFLHKGLNHIYMHYRCPEFKKKRDKKYNKLYGSLESNTVNLYVH